MRRYPRKPHHHTSQIRYALNLSNLLLLINRPPPTGRLEHLSYTENRVLRQLTLRTPFPQVPILSLELTPRTLSTITSPIFSKFVLELGKKTSFPIHSAFLETLGPLGPDRQALRGSICLGARRIQARYQNGKTVRPGRGDVPNPREGQLSVSSEEGLCSI